MEGMSTQDLLNGQDLSTANVDDLLAGVEFYSNPDGNRKSVFGHDS